MDVDGYQRKENSHSDEGWLSTRNKRNMKCRGKDKVKRLTRSPSPFCLRPASPTLSKILERPTQQSTLSQFFTPIKQSNETSKHILVQISTDQLEKTIDTGIPPGSKSPRHKTHLTDITNITPSDASSNLDLSTSSSEHECVISPNKTNKPISLDTVDNYLTSSLISTDSKDQTKSFSDGTASELRTHEESQISQVNTQGVSQPDSYTNCSTALPSTLPDSPEITFSEINTESVHRAVLLDCSDSYNPFSESLTSQIIKHLNKNPPAIVGIGDTELDLSTQALKDNYEEICKLVVL